MTGDTDTLRLRTDDITWRRVGESIVVLDLADSSYLSVNGTGTIIWQCLQSGSDIASILAAVLEKYDVDEETARVDIDRFLADLRTRRLIVS
jgi:Coenzyme PQQ synthesis protein D (PqqD)